MHFDATVDQFMRIPHLHPTLAEIWTYPAEACADAAGPQDPRRRAGGVGHQRRRSPTDAAAARFASRFCRRSPRRARTREISATRARRSRSWPAIRPTSSFCPKAALTGYFLEGAVYDLALPAPRLRTRPRAKRGAPDAERPVDIAAGFFENDGGTYYNSAIYLHVEPGCERIVHLHRKMFLPTYGVFDEERFLSRGRRLSAFETRFGTHGAAGLRGRVARDRADVAAIKGARILIVPSASPGRGHRERIEGELESVTRWREMLRAAALEHGIFVIYAGLAGFEGGKGMTGSSMRDRPARRRAGARHRRRTPASCAPTSTCARSSSRARACRCSAIWPRCCPTCCSTTSFRSREGGVTLPIVEGAAARHGSRRASTRRSRRIGSTRFCATSCVERRGIARAVVGLSGGVDSAVTAFLCARALGPENVYAFRLPYRDVAPREPSRRAARRRRAEHSLPDDRHHRRGRRLSGSRSPMRTRGGAAT